MSAASAVAADWSPSDSSAVGARLLWAPPGDASRLDGAWWPRTTDAREALTELLPVVGAHVGGVVVRVSLNMTAWGAEQPRRIRLAGALVRLGWFTTLDPDVMTLGPTTHDRRTLLVVPADLPAAAGQAIMQRLAKAKAWPDSARAALDGPDAPAADAA
jgi:Family of unknown function (DUF5994)